MTVFAEPHPKADGFSQRMQHARHTAVGTLQNFLASALCLPTGILTAAFLTRQLGSANYGVLTVTVSIVMFIEILTNAGFNRAAVKFISEQSDWQPAATRILQAQLLAGLFGMTVLITAAPLFTTWLNSPQITRTLRLFALDIPIAAVTGLHRSVLIGRGHFGRRAVLSGLFWVSRLMFVILFVTLKPDVMHALTAILCASAVVFIVSRRWTQPALFRRSRFPLPRIWRYSWPLFFFTVGMTGFRRIDLLMVKALDGLPQAAGYYAAAMNLSIIPDLLSGSLAPLLLAKLAYSHGQTGDHTSGGLAHHGMRMLLVLLPFAALTAGASCEIATFIYGPAFGVTGPLLAVLIFGSVGTGLISINTSALIAAGRPRTTFLLMIPTLALAMAGHRLMIPAYGAAGAAAVTTGLAWLGATVSSLMVCRIWQVRLPAATLMRSLGLCIGSYSLSRLWPADGALLLVKLPAIALLIIIAFFVLNEFGPAEIRLWRSLFTNTRPLGS